MLKNYKELKAWQKSYQLGLKNLQSTRPLESFASTNREKNQI